MYILFKDLPVSKVTTSPTPADETVNNALSASERVEQNNSNRRSFSALSSSYELIFSVFFLPHLLSYFKINKTFHYASVLANSIFSTDIVYKIFSQNTDTTPATYCSISPMLPNTHKLHNQNDQLDS